MIKRLFFAALLLLPGVAYAGNPSADLSVQVVDPPVGSPPAAPTPAAAADFTTCVVCFDSTAASGGVYVNGAAVPGVNASQPNTWLDCAGASSPIWFQGSNYSITPELPCPNITSDGAGNPQVLQIWDGPVLNNVNGIKLFNSNNGQGIEAPTNNYMEATYWVASFPSNAYVEGPWMGGGGEIPRSVFNFLEFDAFEMNGDEAPGMSSNWGSNYDVIGCPGGPGCGFPANWYGSYPPNYSGFDITSGYHTIGQRTTSDGTTIYKCMWVDNVFQDCESASVGTGLSSTQLGDTNSRMQTYLVLTGNLSSNPMSGSMIAYVKSFNMWSCANWQTTACRTGSANPGGY